MSTTAASGGAVRRFVDAILRHPEADLSKLPIGLDLRAINLIEGIRAGLSVSAMVALNQWLQWPPMMMAALAAWLACLCDQGGPIQRRLPAVLGFTAAGTLITLGGGLVRNGGLITTVPLASFGLFALSLLRIYGQSAMVVGNLLSVALVLALDRPLDLQRAAVLAAAFLGGGVWASLLTMVIWRIRPYLPARRAVAGAYRALADLVQDLRSLMRAEQPHASAWEEHARAHHRAVRDAIEQARDAVMDTLRMRGASNGRGAQSLIRLEIADQIFGLLIALSELLEAGGFEAERAVIDRVLRHVRAALVVLARESITAEGRYNSRIERSLASLAAELATLGEDDAFRRIADGLWQRLRIAETLAVPENFLPGALPGGERPPLLDRVLRPLKANMSWDSLALRHAVRVAIVAAPATAITVIWAGPYQHWLTITLVLTMQPEFAMTITRAVERIGGTVLGGGIAALIGLICQTPVAMAGAMFPLAVTALAVRRVSFGLFMAAVTPLVVLLSELGGQAASEWAIAGMRALFTLVGGAFALIGCLVLFPSWEPDRLARATRAAIASHGRYAVAELSAILGHGSEEDADQARRAAGVDSNNMESSISRALLEPGHAIRFRLEAALIIDAALRRIAGRLSAMQYDPEIRRAVPAETWHAWRDWIGRAMEVLASEEPGQTLPKRPPDAAGPAGEALSRIARRIELMSGALQRLIREENEARYAGPRT
ncbi:MAG: FUSC family protein [Acetobacteraceae bacterium]|nr:FUSC family protein [Acetobacteraceae bacterium]